MLCFVLVCCVFILICEVRYCSLIFSTYLGKNLQRNVSFCENVDGHIGHLMRVRRTLQSLKCLALSYTVDCNQYFCCKYIETVSCANGMHFPWHWEYSMHKGNTISPHQGQSSGALWRLLIVKRQLQDPTWLFNKRFGQGNEDDYID